MFSYQKAIKAAEELKKLLASSCQRIEIVGSLRRRQPFVNDIDIIAIPAFAFSPDQTLFGELVRQNLLDSRLIDLCAGGHMAFQTNGTKIKRLVVKYSGFTIPADIYIADESTWWTLMLVRTGGRTHNVALARRAIQRHMVLKADGSGLLTAGGDLIPIQSEHAMFHHLGLPYRQPDERE